MKNLPTPQRIIEIKRKRRARNLRRVFLFLVLILTLAIASAYFSSNKKLTINEVKVEGTSIIDSVEVISRVEKNLEGKYYRLYSRANSLIYPKNKIYDDLLETFPRIKDLSIDRQNFNTLSIKIKERLGSYLYCGDSVPEIQSEVGENCYFINNDGYIFDKAPYFSGNVYFKYYTKIENQENPLSQNMIEAELFHKLMRFIDGIRDLNFKPVSLFMGEDGIFSLYLDHNDGDSIPEILFKDENDLENILSNLSTAMNKSEFANEINSKYSSLSYIDLRFKNKVLYKFE